MSFINDLGGLAPNINKCNTPYSVHPIESVKMKGIRGKMRTKKKRKNRNA